MLLPRFRNIKLDNFEGPFDLLLELTHTKKVNLSKVSLSKITDSFLQYINHHKLSSIAQADFAVVAATLLLLKLEHLLPHLTAQENEEINGLSDRVRTYQLYRQQAHLLQSRWLAAPLLIGPERLAAIPSTPFPNYTPLQLKVSFESALKRIKEPINTTRHLRSHGRSLQKCLQLLTIRIKRVNNLWFHDAVAGEDAHTTAISFLAMLELSRRQLLTIKQAKIFDPIRMSKIK